MDFKVGQEIYYAGESIPERNLFSGTIYRVRGIEYCKCGQLVDIGITHESSFCYCNQCGDIINIDDRLFFDSYIFIPVRRVNILKAFPPSIN
jgi:hypothetical protein